MRIDFINLTGKKFGRWTVLEFAGKNQHGQALWLCECECKTRKTIRGGGKIFSKSCGCLQREKAASTMAKAFKKHGEFGTPLYGVWAAMKRRCENPKVKEYANYGGRGITYNPEWVEYENFRNWAVKSGYQQGLTLDRIETDGNYEPKNCQWVTMKDQQRNRRNNVWIEIDGQNVMLADLSRSTGILDKTLYSRYKKGARSIEELTKATDSNVIYVVYDGQKISLRQFAKIHGLNYGTIWKRYKNGASSIEELARRV
jgi:hypothetical protein